METPKVQLIHMLLTTPSLQVLPAKTMLSLKCIRISFNFLVRCKWDVQIGLHCLVRWLLRGVQICFTLSIGVKCLIQSNLPPFLYDKQGKILWKIHQYVGCLGAIPHQYKRPWHPYLWTLVLHWTLSLQMLSTCIYKLEKITSFGNLHCVVLLFIEFWPSNNNYVIRCTDLHVFISIIIGNVILKCVMLWQVMYAHLCPLEYSVSNVCWSYFNKVNKYILNCL